MVRFRKRIFHCKIGKIVDIYIEEAHFYFYTHQKDNTFPLK
jgi:hypothetical protein